MLGFLQRERATVRRGLAGESRVPGQAGNHLGREATGQEPEELPTAALDRILCAPGASCEFVDAQVRFEVDVTCHATRSTTVWRDPVLLLASLLPAPRQYS